VEKRTVAIFEKRAAADLGIHACADFISLHFSIFVEKKRELFDQSTTIVGMNP